LLQDENVSINELLGVISYDMAISTRLLKVSNSAYYGFMKKIATVRHAITVLGLRQVKSLALGITVFEAIKKIGGMPSLDPKDLWLHSIASAMASSLLSSYIPSVDKDIAFTVSLLHDMGKLPLNGLFPADYAKVLDASANESFLFSAEEDVFGFEHGEVGGWLCESWKLPQSLRNAIKYHHYPDRAEPGCEVLSAVITCSDHLAKTCGIGFGGDIKTDVIPSEAMGIIGINELQLTELQEKLSAKKEHAQSFFEATQ